MLLNKLLYTKLGKMCLVALVGVALVTGCGAPAAPTESINPPTTAPSIETPSYVEVHTFVIPEHIPLSQLVFPQAISVEQNRQTVDTFKQSEPATLQNLDAKLVNYYPDLNTPLGAVNFNWESSSAAYILDPNNNYQVDVLAVPVQLSDPNAFSPDRLATMIASGTLNQFVVGGILVRSDLESSLARGNYLAIWQAGVNEVWLVNPETGDTVQAASCQTDVSTFQPTFELFEGSLGWCIKFDSRKCCV